MTKVITPKTKDGKHEIVFPEDFRDNHGFGLRGALEGRLCHSLLRIGREDPERAREINEHYSFVCGAKLSPEHVPHNISIPHIAKIKPVRTLKIGESDYLIGDEFKEETFPIFGHSQDYVSLTPWTRDSDHVYQIYRVAGAKMCQVVPELQGYLEWFGLNVFQGDHNMIQRAKELNGDIILISQDRELSDFLEKRSKFFVLHSLAEARLHHSEDIRSIYPRLKGIPPDYFADLYDLSVEQVFASEELIKKLAVNAEALCLEYLLEMKEDK